MGYTTRDVGEHDWQLLDAPSRPTGTTLEGDPLESVNRPYQMLVWA
jgi:hypothetical protein